MNQEAPPSQGLVAGKYQLVRMIGRGGMGSVWEARHVSLGTSSAIKFIESDYADSHEARSRFDKEAKAAATIQSKHAIQIFDHGVTDDGKPYIVMEMLQGEPLDKRIERLRQMTLPDTARILQQVCRGLARAHERGIIHRDLKPENIFIVRTPDDDEEIAKVLDFGIAKIAAAPGSPGVTSSTKTGAVLGTPFYMSPEQARGLRNVDHRTDCWSLGVIAFKCLTGKLPFDGESVGDLLVKICTAPIPVPSQMAPGLPPSFDAWFARALERDPERRFPNVTELADAICYAAGIASRARGSTPFSQMPYSEFGSTTPSGAPNNRSGTPGYGTPPPHVATPPPGGMTGAPFTSESIPGVPPAGSGKLIAGIVGAVMLAVGAGGGFLFIRSHRPHVDAVNGVVVPPPSASVEVAPASASQAAPPLPVDTIPGAATATTASSTSTHATKTTPAPAKTSAKVAPTTPNVIPPLPGPTPPTPAPTPTTKKKPDKYDSGY